MLLEHDVGGIDTGDTSGYAEARAATRKAAMLTAVTRNFDLLLEPQAYVLM